MNTFTSPLAAGAGIILVFSVIAGAESIWIEGENATEAKVVKHPWYDGQVKRDQLSGGDLLSHFSKEYPGTARYDFESRDGGNFELWVRANPVQSHLTWQLDGGETQVLDMTRRQTGNTNIASDDKPDLRFLAWANAGKVTLSKGHHKISFRFDSPNQNHGSLDCFVFAPESFQPAGTLTPEDMEDHQKQLARSNAGWIPWLPQRDSFQPSPIDLRPLNERFAGENGGIVTRGADFIYRKTGQVVRFWGVNGPPATLKGEALAECARMLAKRGVNLVRIHGAVFDEKTGALDPARIDHVHDVVAAMKKEGIYSHLSVYFPLWLRPQPGPGWREGYDGNHHPFALLYFEPELQALYRTWVKALLQTPGTNGVPLARDPAVMSVEIINEDSLFFWTFDEKNIPDAQLRKLESRFAAWAVGKHGSQAKTLAAWGNLSHPRDTVGRLGFRPLYQIFTDRTPRDQDTAAFLMETQRGFYQDTAGFVKGLGFNGLIIASNWTTANNDILMPLEKYSYTVGDFIDRHGYFGCDHQGDNAGWSIREGHTYADRSALRFEAESPGKPKDFSHPSADPCYNGMPSMISETTWDRPNKYRGEAPLFYAAYGALQGSAAIVHFALDSQDWAVKPGFFMQPWTLMTPTQAGQFPAAAFIFRKGLIRIGDVLADLSISLADATALKGSPLAPKASLDELRKADTAGQAATRIGGIDPLIHFAGRTAVNIGGTVRPNKIADLRRYIDRNAQRVVSTNGDVRLDYGKGLLTLHAPSAQGALGDLKSAGTIELPDIELISPLVIGEIVAISLDGNPISSSGHILLQVMSEEKASGFTTVSAGNGLQRIGQIGTDPWLMRKLEGVVRFKRADAARLKVTPLDLNGIAFESTGSAERIILRPDTVYYMIER